MFFKIIKLVIGFYICFFIFGFGKGSRKDPDGNDYFLHSDTNEIFFIEGLSTVLDRGTVKWGVIDEEGKEIVPFIYNHARMYNDGLVAVKKDGKWGFIDKEGKIIIPFIYLDAEYYSNGLASVKNEQGWGFINIKGKIIIPFIYEGIDYDFSFDEKNNYGRKIIETRAKKDNLWGTIDKNGKFNLISN